MHAATALGVLHSLRSLPEHRFIPDDSSLAAAKISLMALAGSKQVTDLHLVNLAATRGAVLVSFDAGIAQALTAEDGGLIEILSA